MIADHILQACPTYPTMRKKHWPEDMVATKKLYSAREELQRTAAFIEETGLAIRANEDEEKDCSLLVSISTKIQTDQRS
jgi:hypothetical protein